LFVDESGIDIDAGLKVIWFFYGFAKMFDFREQFLMIGLE